jgi:hypothetical protein
MKDAGKMQEGYRKVGDRSEEGRRKVGGILLKWAIKWTAESKISESRFKKLLIQTISK